MNPYMVNCADFYTNLRLGTKISFPRKREIVVPFFDLINKRNPSLNQIRKTKDVFRLESPISDGFQKWICIDANRIASGYTNPREQSSAMRMFYQLLECAPHNFGISGLEIDYLDFVVGFEFECGNNADEIVSKSLLSGSPLCCLSAESESKIIDVQPFVTVALNRDTGLVATIKIDTLTVTDSIAVQLIVRQHWNGQDLFPKERGNKDPNLLITTFKKIRNLADRFCIQYLVPKVLTPIYDTIVVQ